MDLQADISSKVKRSLIYLPAGIVTTPETLFKEFTTASLAMHGIRKIISHNSSFQFGMLEQRFVVRLAKSDMVINISANQQIKYAGFKKWEVL